MKYIVVNLFDGVVEYTNDELEAKNMSMCEDFYVIDVEKKMWLVETELQEIKEIK